MRNRIRNWLLSGQGANDGAEAPLRPSVHHGLDATMESIKERTSVEFIPANNGYIVVARKHKYNPHGADKVDVDVSIVPEGADLFEAVKRAVATLGLM